MQLHEVAQALNATALGPDVAFDVVSSDSRALPPGCLFIALKGPRHDGHAFAAQALEQGAAALMLEAVGGNGDAYAAYDLPPGASVLLVEDTRLALGRLAAWQRSRMPARVAAITGSNGKTTVKEMVAAILALESGTESVLATQGNLNNDIGMPLTLLQLTPQHRYAVIEMGMNHPGELAYLSALAQPDVALVNNALRAHLQGLGSLEAVARAKGEIYGGLAAEGTAIINIDDPHAELWLALNAGRKVLTFGFSRNADVAVQSLDDTAVNWQLGDPDANLRLRTPLGFIQTTLGVPGLHNLANAAAAAACALALGAGPEAIARGLAHFTGVKGRLQVHPCVLGAHLIDDTYNANPDSVLAAIQVLAERPGTRILVLGDMGELGAGAAAMHREVGEQARAAGIDRLLCLGELSIHAAQGFGTGAMHFERIEELLAEIECALGAATTVLVKGSRFMKMERVVQSFADRCEAIQAAPAPAGARPPAADDLAEDTPCS